MPKLDKNPNRCKTRAANAHAHPGKAAMEALAVRRKREDIDAEKKARDERRKIKLKKKTDEQAAVMDIAEFEDQMALDDINDEATFPRHQTKVNGPNESGIKNKNRKGHKDRTARTTNEKKPAYKKKAAEFDELTDNDQPQVKKQKTVNGHPNPLRRTETYIQIDDSNGRSAVEFPDERNTPNDEDTPKALQKKRRVIELSEDDDGASPVESEDEDFTTPKALLRKGPGRTDRDSNFVAITSESDLSELESDNPEFRNIDLTKVTRTQKDKRALRKEVEEQRGLVVKGNQKITLRRNDEIVPAPTVTLSQLARSKSKPNNTPDVQSRTSATSGNSVGISIQSAHTRRETHPKSKPTTKTTKNFTDEDFERAVNLRMEQLTQEAATASNSNQSAPIDAGKRSRSKCKPNSLAAKPTPPDEDDSIEQATVLQDSTEGKKQRVSGVASGNGSGVEFADTTGTLSDEDDSIERAVILQSPLKGIKRLSSGAIVKIVKSSSGSNESRRSRSKGQILDPDTLTGWSKSIVPNFLYCYLYELSPWPTTKDIEACAQKLWDWRFGDSFVLDLADNPGHIQLLNQKLCDIQTQSASSAIGNVDTEFQLSMDPDIFELPEDEIIQLRQDYAQDLMADKKFIFGKYVVSPNGTVHKSRPYQGKILLRTFASSFKHIKDVRSDETDAPLPSSSYPKTLLAIAAAAVERALSLTVENDYDFVKHKLVPKPDPGHLTKKPTTSMFAFSETVWQARAEFYLDKGISKLKEKDWEKIMDAAADFSNVLKAPTSKGKGKGRASAMVEEEDLAWDSESDKETDE